MDWVPMTRRLLLLAFIMSPLGCLAHEASSDASGFGLVGYGIAMWEPSCAHACQRFLALSPLSCSETHQHDAKSTRLAARHGGHDEDFSTSPECFNHDRAFLLSLAWCIHERCEEGHHDTSELWRLERFWETDAVPGAHHPPNYTYAQALAECDGGLDPVLSRGRLLKEPSSVSDEDFASVQTYLEDFARVETQHSHYGMFLALLMTFLPLVLSLAHFLASAASPAAERLILAHIVEPALWGRRHLVSLPYEVGMLPLRGQALLILFIIFLNISLSAVGYQGSLPNFHYDTESDAFWTYLSNRAGYLSFANLFVVFLYSGRNNPLLFLSGWKYGTFVLLHRWVAYICIAQATTHSLIKLVRHIPVFSSVFTKLYWNIGFAAFLIFLAIFATSILPFRRRWYQAFLDIHNVLAVAVLVLCFLHVYVEFGYAWGYENWIVLASVIWAGEKLARLIKTAAHGVHTAVVSPLDEEYMEITIEGVSETGYVYLSFPQGWWRLWESHPFSVASAVTSAPGASGLHAYSLPENAPPHTMFGLDSESESEKDPRDSQDFSADASEAMLGAEPQEIPLADLTTKRQRQTNPSSISTPLNYEERAGNEDDQTKAELEEADNLLLPSDRPVAPGLSFLVRRQRGLTHRLFHSSDSRKVLIEGPYHSAATLPILSAATSQVFCIVGGSGITAVMPLLRSRASGAAGRTVLYWSCRSEGLVAASGVKDLGTAIEANILVGQRWNVEQVLHREAMGLSGDAAVVTCGPASMADDVRCAVVAANRDPGRRGVIRLYEECYSW